VWIHRSSLLILASQPNRAEEDGAIVIPIAFILVSLSIVQTIDLSLFVRPVAAHWSSPC
jgi:hypothetical protein